jgi:mono/diheme cytochrome c family protein
MIAFRFFAIGLAWLALATPAMAQSSASAKRGEAIVKANCAECHAVTRTGDSPNAKAPPFRTLGQRYKLDDLQEALAEGIVVGHGGADMPHFVFEPTEIDDIIAYLKQINRQR